MKLTKTRLIPPSRCQIGGPIFDKLYSETMIECKNKYEGVNNSIHVFGCMDGTYIMNQ